MPALFCLSISVFSSFITLTVWLHAADKLAIREFCGTRKYRASNPIVVFQHTKHLNDEVELLQLSVKLSYFILDLVHKKASIR